MLIINLRVTTKKITQNNIVKETRELNCTLENIHLAQEKALIEEEWNKKDITHTENK